MPRTIRSIAVPALRRVVQRVDQRGSTRLFIFSVMRPAGPSSACRSMRSASALRRCVGRDEQLAVLGLTAVPGEVVEEVGEVGAELGIGG